MSNVASINHDTPSKSSVAQKLQALIDTVRNAISSQTGPHAKVAAEAAKLEESYAVKVNEATQARTELENFQKSGAYLQAKPVLDAAAVKRSELNRAAKYITLFVALSNRAIADAFFAMPTSKLRRTFITNMTTAFSDIDAELSNVIPRNASGERQKLTDKAWLPVDGGLLKLHELLNTADAE